MAKKQLKMKNKAYFIKTLEGLINDWGSDTPPEAVWAFNNLLGFAEMEYKVSFNEQLEEDLSNYDSVMAEVNKLL